MEMLKKAGLDTGVSSGGLPIQHHPAYVANDVVWIQGTLQTNGNPHNYINQDGLLFLTIEEPHVAPWTFTGLPASEPPLIVTTTSRIQLIFFPGEGAMEQYREPIRTEKVMIHTPLAVIHGAAPFLSEAELSNFLEFWRGVFFPISDASVYYLAESTAPQPAKTPLLYINRNAVLSYTGS